MEKIIFILVVLLIIYTRPIMADQLYKPIIKKFGKCKVYCSVKDNIWAEVFADMQLITKYNKGFRFLLCLIHIFSEYAWKVSLKDKKCIEITNEFENISGVVHIIDIHKRT